MRLTTKLALCALAFIAATPASAREIGFWTSASAEKEIGYGIDGSFGAEYRTIGNHIDRWGFDLGADRTIWTSSDNAFKLNAGIGYKYTRNLTTAKIVWKSISDYNYHNSYWRNRSRISLQLAGKYEFDRWDFTLRERYQFNITGKASYVIDKHTKPTTSQDFIYGHKEKSKESEKEHIARTQLGAAYDIAHCKFDPFASMELFNSLSNGMKLEKTKFTLGCDWKITKGQALEGAMVFQNRAADGEPAGFAVSFSYKYKF